MIEKIDITGNDYKVEDPLKKYIIKRIGKLDRYLPKQAKNDVICKVVIEGPGKGKGDRFNVSVAMGLTGGKTIAARDECSNVFAGVDLVEAKLLGQIRRYKLEVQPHRQKKSFKNLFRKRG
ncbi:ribosome-associated translation inhibitor RaiA [Candidatus Saccharibacteria bacterium]|nr:ribosome-associated translation inhibitor RaiA [Candidatus Saccharibacteria bacterium]